MLLLIALLATAAVTAGECPDGFEDLGLEDDRCYYISGVNPTPSDVLSWTPAFVECQNKGGDLLSVSDPLHFYPMSAITQQGSLNAWTGLLNLGGVRSWADETPFNPDLEQFIVEPAADETFGYIATQDGLLHFTNNTEVMSFICYADVAAPTSTTPAPTVPPACPDGWVEYDGNCYLFSKDAQYWTTAEHSCVGQGANLVSIHDQSLLTFLLLSAGDDAFWVGLQNDGDRFVWADGTGTDDISIVTPFLDNWELGKNCVALKKEAYPKPLVHEDCFTMNKYVCFKDALHAYVDYADFASLYWNNA